MQKLIEEQMRVQVEKEKQKMIYQMKPDAAAAAAAAKQSSSLELSSMVLSLIVCNAPIVTLIVKISFCYHFTAIPVINFSQNTRKGKPDHPDFKTFSQAFAC